MRVCEYVASFLKNKGVRDVFGVPGYLIMPVWQNLEGMLHLCTNEVDACYMATGYGKYSHRTGVVVTTSSPGVTNSISGLASANIDSIPLLHISGAISDCERGNGLFQEEGNYNRLFESSEILQPVTKACYYASSAEEAVVAITEGWDLANSGRCGCVHITIPINIQNEIIVEPLPMGSLRNTTDPFTSEICGLYNASRPLIIVGWGVYLEGCIEDVYTLAERLDSPIMTTMKGLSLIDYNNPYYLGTLGFQYEKTIDTFIRTYQPDCVIVLGSSVGKKDFTDQFIKSVGSARWIVVSNEDTCFKKRHLTGRAIRIASLRQYIESLLKETDNTKKQHVIKEEIAKSKQERLSLVRSQIGEEDVMAACINYICANASGGLTITADAGNHFLNAISTAMPTGEKSFFVDAGLAAMGIGISETIGMAYSEDKAKFIAITGDGCMLMNGNSIYNAARDNLNIIFVVFNNNSLGRVREGQRLKKSFIATDIEGVDYVQYGKSLGINTVDSADSIDAFIKIYDKYVQLSGPSLIEVKTSKDEIPLSLRKHTY